MTKHFLSAACIIGAVFAGCSGSSDDDPEGQASSFGGSGGAVASGGNNGLGGPATGSFCDVQALLASRCQSCHSAPPQAGVPMPLVTHEDLAAPAVSNASIRVVDASLARMQSTVAPMPPAPLPPPTSEEIAVLQAWVDAGLPATCDAQATGGTSGAP